MKSLNEEIMEVKEKIRKETKWREHAERLNEDLDIKYEKVSRLKKQLENEKENVAELHSFSLASVFAAIAGNKQEKLTEREKEVTAAKLNYQEAVQTQTEMENERDEYVQLLERLGDVNLEYEKLLERKEDLIHDSESLWSDQLFEITEKEAEITGNIEEYQEAAEAGIIAQKALGDAEESFNKAKGWSTYEFFGGGLITTAIKHSHLDDAKETVHNAERRLRQFQDELLDIQNHMKVDLQLGDLLTFADYFFSGVIVNWMVHDKITQAADQISETQALVNRTLEKLDADQKAMLANLDQLSRKRIKLIEQA